jgi:N utilization substance protein A
MKSDFMMALNQLSAERGLAKDQVLSAIEVALASAFRRDDPAGGQNLSVKLNPNTGDISIFALRTVVEEVEFPETEILLGEAQRSHPNILVGDEIAESEEVPHDASRIAAQTARQVIMQRLREAEREKIFEEYSAYQGELISGSIESVEKGPTVFVNLNPHQAQNQNRARGIMRPDNQVGNERYRKGQSLKVLLVEVQQTPRGPEVVVSRSHRDLLRRLMESEVPEISNGTVEIRAIAREPGVRSKVAVASHQEGVDPVGSCIGLRGNRIQSIVNELQGEKIDVIEWDSNPRVLIGRALSPADVGAVELDQDENTAYVVVPESQMSLAIGRDGQNARLAARLSGWRLDIKNVEQWSALRAARAAEAARAEAVRLAEEAAAAEALAAQQAAAAARASEAAPVEPEPADIMPVAEAAKAAIAETGLVVEAPDAQVVAAAEVPAEPVVEAVIEESVDVEMGAVALAEPAIAAAQPAEVEIIDEDALLEALIAEEEADAAEAPVAASAGVGLSVDALESFTLEDVVDESDESDEFDDEEIDEEPEEEDTTDLLAGLPNLAPDAGKIRFAEDIVGDFRGGEGRRRRGGGANRRGGNVPGARGPGARRR